MVTMLVLLNSTALLGCAATILLLCRVLRRVDRVARLFAEVEAQETMDRLLIQMPQIEPEKLEQHARVEVRPLAVRILREALGDGYDSWLAETALKKAGGKR